MYLYYQCYRGIIHAKEKKPVRTEACGRRETSPNMLCMRMPKYKYKPVCEIFFEISFNFFKNHPQLTFLYIIQIYQNL